MANNRLSEITPEIIALAELAVKNGKIPAELYTELQVKRGLRAPLILRGNVGAILGDHALRASFARHTRGRKSSDSFRADRNELIPLAKALNGLAKSMASVISTALAE